MALGGLDKAIARPHQSRPGVIACTWTNHFPAGGVADRDRAPSPNLNANEVSSPTARLKCWAGDGQRKPVHPNDHVNMKPVVQRQTYPPSNAYACADEIHHRCCRR